MKPLSSLVTILITGFMWLMVIVGCTSGTRTGQLSNSSKDPRIEFKHGSKITVHHNKEQNKTFFTQDDIKISPDIINGSQKVSGKHAFEIDITATSQGSSSPDKVTLTFLHDTPNKNGWQYPRPTKFLAIAEGQRLECLCVPSSSDKVDDTKTKCLVSDALTKDDPRDADYYEALFMDIPFESFVALGNAKSVQIEMGEASFALPAETVLAFHDFAEIMAKK
jgi:hypothetical protein